MSATPVKFADSPLLQRLARRPPARLWRHLACWYAFDFVIVHRP
jgi:hypothetical protein